MKKNKMRVIALVSGILLAPVSLYALKGTAIRRVINNSAKKFMMIDSNGKTFVQGAATVNKYGALVPTQTDYHRTNDPEIKQSLNDTAKLYIYDQATYNAAMNEYANNPQRFFSDIDPFAYYAKPTYILSDYDWRIWLVVNGKRTSTMVYDKQYLKKLYKAYRVKAASKSLSSVFEIAKGAATSTMPSLDIGGLAELANRPPTKDVRLNIMPDGSIIFTPDYEDNADTPPDLIISDLIARYKGSPDEDYRYLYGLVLDEALRTSAYKEVVEEALEEINAE